MDDQTKSVIETVFNVERAEEDRSIFGSRIIMEYDKEVDLDSPDMDREIVGDVEEVIGKICACALFEPVALEIHTQNNSFEYLVQPIWPMMYENGTLDLPQITEFIFTSDIEVSDIQQRRSMGGGL